MLGDTTVLRWPWVEFLQLSIFRKLKSTSNWIDTNVAPQLIWFSFIWFGFDLVWFGLVCWYAMMMICNGGAGVNLTRVSEIQFKLDPMNWIAPPLIWFGFSLVKCNDGGMAVNRSWDSNLVQTSSRQLDPPLRFQIVHLKSSSCRRLCSGNDDLAKCNIWRKKEILHVNVQSVTNLRTGFDV